MVLDRTARYGTRRMFRYKRGATWRELSWQDFGDQLVRAARGLAGLGFQAGDRLAILAENRPEWPLVDLACLFLGGVDVPLYLTSHPDDLAYIMRDAGVRFLAVAGNDQREKLRAIVADVPSLAQVVHLDPETARDHSRLGHLPALGLDGLLARGDAVPDVSQPVAQPDLATIIYTSGTTGLPKGVMLTHANMLANAEDATRILPITEADQTVSFLPLSHGFERTAGLYTILRAGACIAYGGGTVSLTKDLSEVRPTLLCSVPRLLELVYRRVLSEKERAPRLRQTVLRWALAVGEAAGRCRVPDGSGPAHPGRLPPALSLKHRLADRLVFQKLRQALGGRIRFLVSGGAPLNPDIARFFYGVGITVYEGYGLTEAGPVVACNMPGKTRLGSVGPALPQVSVRIAEDGEICVRGPNVMRGYYNKPEETAQVIDDEGWLYTGDVGELDKDGFIRITDRKKDLIITSEGENIAPQPIEGLFRQDPLIEEACLIGDQRPYLTVLLAPNRAYVETVARKHELDAGWPGVLTHPTLQALFRKRFDAVNRGLPLYARLRKFAVLSEPFTQERNELTPTLKVKRRHVLETRQAEIDALYSKGARDTGA